MTTEIYVWQELDPKHHHQWSNIAPLIPHLGVHLMLATSNREAAQNDYRDQALRQHERTGHPVRLARYVLADEEVLARHGDDG